MPDILKDNLLYPGITLEYETWVLKIYLDLIEEHAAIAKDQYKLREKQDLKRLRSYYTKEQLNGREHSINHIAETIIPLYFLNTAVIPIWSQFESFVEVLANYVHQNEKIELKIKDIRADNIILQASKYFKVTLNVELPWSEKDKNELLKLKELRNAVAHDNGRILGKGDSYYDRMSELVDSTDGVELSEDDDLIVITASYLHKSAELVTRVLSQLNKLISDKYGGLVEAVDAFFYGPR